MWKIINKVIIMTKKVLVVSTSLRKNSNSETLADAFIRGAAASGHQVEKVSLADKQISFCRGCMACQTLGRCVIDDDANAIARQMLRSDVVVFATPIYYYEMSGQMKTLLDRLNCLYDSDYTFTEAYFLSAAAEDAEDVDERAVHGFEGWIACYERCHLAGTVFAGGVDAPGEIRGHQALQAAFDMGAAIC